MLITRKSVFTGKMNTMDLKVTGNQISEFESGVSRRYIQNIFPDLTPDEREFIKTGVTPEEWDIHMGPEDEDLP